VVKQERDMEYKIDMLKESFENLDQFQEADDLDFDKQEK